MLLIGVLATPTDHGFAYQAGTYLGLIAFAMLAMQFVLFARLHCIARPFGLDALFLFDRAMGTVASFGGDAGGFGLGGGGEGLCRTETGGGVEDFLLRGAGFLGAGIAGGDKFRGGALQEDRLFSRWSRYRPELY